MRVDGTGGALRVNMGRTPAGRPPGTGDVYSETRISRDGMPRILTNISHVNVNECARLTGVSNISGAERFGVLTQVCSGYRR